MTFDDHIDELRDRIRAADPGQERDMLLIDLGGVLMAESLAAKLFPNDAAEEKQGEPCPTQSS